MDNLQSGFNNPNRGTLGIGMAQKAGSMLNYRAAYNQCVQDQVMNGQEALPMDQFVAQLAMAMKQRGGGRPAQTGLLR